jgi:hypothetical protein
MDGCGRRVRGHDAGRYGLPLFASRGLIWRLLLVLALFIWRVVLGLDVAVAGLRVADEILPGYGCGSAVPPVWSLWPGESGDSAPAGWVIFGYTSGDGRDVACPTRTLAYIGARKKNITAVLPSSTKYPTGRTASPLEVSFVFKGLYPSVLMSVWYQSSMTRVFSHSFQNVIQLPSN